MEPPVQLTPGKKPIVFPGHSDTSPFKNDKKKDDDASVMLSETTCNSRFSSFVTELDSSHSLLPGDVAGDCAESQTSPSRGDKSPSECESSCIPVISPRVEACSKSAHPRTPESAKLKLGIPRLDLTPIVGVQDARARTGIATSTSSRNESSTRQAWGKSQGASSTDGGNSHRSDIALDMESINKMLLDGSSEDPQMLQNIVQTMSTMIKELKGQKETIWNEKEAYKKANLNFQRSALESTRRESFLASPSNVDGLGVLNSPSSLRTFSLEGADNLMPSPIRTVQLNNCNGTHVGSNDQVLNGEVSKVTNDDEVCEATNNAEGCKVTNNGEVNKVTNNTDSELSPNTFDHLRGCKGEQRATERAPSLDSTGSFLGGPAVPLKPFNRQEWPLAGYTGAHTERRRVPSTTKKSSRGSVTARSSGLHLKPRDLDEINGVVEQSMEVSLRKDKYFEFESALVIQVATEEGNPRYLSVIEDTGIVVLSNRRSAAIFLCRGRKYCAQQATDLSDPFCRCNVRVHPAVPFTPGTGSATDEWDMMLIEYLGRTTPNGDIKPRASDVPLLLCWGKLTDAYNVPGANDDGWCVKPNGNSFTRSITRALPFTVAFLANPTGGYDNIFFTNRGATKGKQTTGLYSLGARSYFCVGKNNSLKNSQKSQTEFKMIPVWTFKLMDKMGVEGKVEEGDDEEGKEEEGKGGSDHGRAAGEGEGDTSSSPQLSPSLSPALTTSAKKKLQKKKKLAKKKLAEESKNDDNSKDSGGKSSVVGFLPERNWSVDSGEAVEGNGHNNDIDGTSDGATMGFLPSVTSQRRGSNTNSRRTSHGRSSAMWARSSSASSSSSSSSSAVTHTDLTATTPTGAKATSGMNSEKVSDRCTVTHNETVEATYSTPPNVAGGRRRGSEYTEGSMTARPCTGRSEMDDFTRSTGRGSLTFRETIPCNAQIHQLNSDELSGEGGNVNGDMHEDDWFNSKRDNDDDNDDDDEKKSEDRCNGETGNNKDAVSDDEEVSSGLNHTG